MGRTWQQGKVKIDLPKGISVRKHKHSNSIQIYFSYKGVDCRETLKLEPTKTNIRYAGNLRGEILNSIEKGSFKYSEYFPNSKKAALFGHTISKATIGDLLDEYLALAKKTKQPSTVRGYKDAIKSHLKPQFGSIRVRDLTPNMLRTWITGLSVTAKRVRNILIPLRAVLETAVNDDLIERNPLDRIVLNQLLDKNSKTSNFKIDPFNKQEIKIILSSSEGQVKNLFQFAFFSGLRTSELIALSWDDVDFKKGIVKVTHAIVEKQMKTTKTKAGIRELILLPPAIQALKSQREFTAFSERVFHNPRTNKPWIDDQQIRKTAWIPLLKKCDIEYRNPYQTRHTYASMLLSGGENVWWVAQQMGHENIEMLMKHYGKWIPDQSKKNGYQPNIKWAEIWNETAPSLHSKPKGA